MRTIILLVLGTFIFSGFVSADVITPGFKHLEINNKIVNINNYYDEYIFFSAGSITNNVQIIERDGIIPKYYKLSKVSVFAIPRNRGISEDEIIKYSNAYNHSTN